MLKHPVAVTIVDAFTRTPGRIERSRVGGVAVTVLSGTRVPR